MATKKKLTKVQTERVAVLKDAVLQLKLSVYKANRSGYVSLENEPDWKRIADAQEELKEVGIKVNVKQKEVKTLLKNLINKNKPCEVCAKGALAISAIKKFNNLSINEVAEECDLNEVADFKASKFFGDKNADKMEKFYENWPERADDDKERIQIEHWVREHGHHTEESLIAIFSNAIKNNGIFKP